MLHMVILKHYCPTSSPELVLLNIPETHTLIRVDLLMTIVVAFATSDFDSVTLMLSSIIDELYP